MLQRGKKPASLSLLQSGDGPTLPCPSYFDDQHKALWDEMVRAYGAEYFTVGSRPLLEQFVCITILGRSKEIGRKERIAIALSLAKLASNMRISQYSSYERPKRKAKTTIWQGQQAV